MSGVDREKRTKFVACEFTVPKTAEQPGNVNSWTEKQSLQARASLGFAIDHKLIAEQRAFEQRKLKAIPKKYDEPSQARPFDDGSSDEAFKD